MQTHGSFDARSFFALLLAAVGKAVFITDKEKEMIIELGKVTEETKGTLNDPFVENGSCEDGERREDGIPCG